MSRDETISTSSTGAQKAENLERYDLIPAEPLRQLALHYGRGALKYADRNWEKGYEWHKSFAALMRHAWEFWAGEDIDEETGSPHIIAAMWHCCALAEYMRTHREFDDRAPRVNTEPHFANVRVPRVVASLGPDERDAEWISDAGYRYRWDNEREWMSLRPGGGGPGGDTWRRTVSYINCGPYVEALTDDEIRAGN